MSSFIHNPRLPFVRPDFPGNFFQAGQFHHAQYASAEAPLGRVLRWQLLANPQKQEKVQDPFQLRCVSGSRFLSSSEDTLVWLGHASFFIRINGVTMITDPCWGNLPLLPRKVGLPVPIGEFQNIDYLLLSHGHRDHYDTKCVNQLIEQNPSMELLLPLKLSELLGRRRATVSYQEAAWWQQYETNNDIEITFLPAKHWNRRWLHDFNQQLWGSFLLRGGSRSVYFGGDSAYAGHFAEIKQWMGAPEVCLLPVGAYKPPFMMQEAHMNPAEAVRAFRDLGGSTLVPDHYGTYDLSDEPAGEPVRLLKAAQADGKISADELRFLEVGEPLTL